jgi:hypothetical protein
VEFWALDHLGEHGPYLFAAIVVLGFVAMLVLTVIEKLKHLKNKS